MIVLEDRVLLHLQNGRRIPVDPQEIYLLEAEPLGFAQIHRSWAVNLRRVREIRQAPEGGWEVKLDPPVNRVLPVSRRRISALWERFGE